MKGSVGRKEKEKIKRSTVYDEEGEINFYFQPTKPAHPIHTRGGVKRSPGGKDTGKRGLKNEALGIHPMGEFANQISKKKNQRKGRGRQKRDNNTKRQRKTMWS